MADDEKHSVEAARAAAERGDLDAWVAEFLASPGSDNEELGEELTGRPRWWLGPVRVPTDRLNRLAGPPGEPVLVPVDEEEWRDDVDDLAEKVDDGWEPPPVIASYQDGHLKLEDGNHRVEGLRRTGEAEVWTIIGFDSEQDRQAYEDSAETG